MPKYFGIQIGAPTMVEMAVDEAIALITEENYPAAIEVLETKALTREPDNRRVLLHLGIAHMMNKDYDRALGFLVPLTERRGMDSEKAAAEIALEKIAKDRADG